jgi:lysozyme
MERNDVTQNDPNKVLSVAENVLTIPAEGEVLHPYQDPRGIWTIGTGSTTDLNGNPVTAETPPINHAENLLLLSREMLFALSVVERDVAVPLTVDEEAALVDFVFNVGAGNFEASTLLRDLKAENYEAAADQFLRWDHVGGAVLAGLARRCAARRALFLKPDAQS